ncbi:amidohydrolase [bacterium]|nr:amidohydrolase [bacterium]
MMQRHARSGFVLLLILSLTISACNQKAPTADRIFENGRFYTGEETPAAVSCLAVRGDRILALGGPKDMDVYRGPDTEIIDLEGRFACAGFNDAHMQQLNGSIGLIDLDLRDVRTPDEIARMVYSFQRADPQPWDVWIIGWGWDESVMDPAEWEDFHDHTFRSVWLQRPMIFYRVCGHVAIVNQRALNIAGIDADTPDPAGGRIAIITDPRTNKSTGVLRESAIDLVRRFIPPPDPERLRHSLDAALARMAACGITSAQGHGSIALYRAARSLLAEGRLTCRMSFWSTDMDSLLLMRRLHDSDMLTAGLLFESLDGGMAAHNASMMSDYHDSPGERGIIKHSQDGLNRLVLTAQNRGFQVALQAVGDRANSMALEAYGLAVKMAADPDKRYRIEHAQVLREADIPRFAETGTIASMQPSHCIDDMHWIEDRIGTRRSRCAYAWRALLDGGARLAFGSYWPVAPLDPLYGLYAAVTRRDTAGYPLTGWHPEQRITIQEAIQAYTCGSAYAERMEDDKGTLKVGKLADIVVLDRNILEINPSGLLDTEVVHTILGGRIIYSRGDGARNAEIE